MTAIIGITKSYDECAENPFTDTDIKFVSFNRRHINHEDPDNYVYRNDEGDWIGADVGTRRKLHVGTAFILGYSEHGLCRWSIGGRDGWDSRACGGVLIIPADQVKGMTYGQRQVLAEYYASVYTDWCNGRVFCLEYEDETVGGFMGDDRELAQAARDTWGLPAEADIEIIGD